MAIIRNKILPMLAISAIALAGAACTKDKMSGDGSMINDTGSMNHMDNDKKMSDDKGMMKN